MRELQKEAAKRRESVRRVPEADVLITNPTHLGVALSYKRGEMTAPQLIAKGAGELVEYMKQQARKHHIPIIENKPLAQNLFKKVKLDAYIPEVLYSVVASVLLQIYAMQERQILREGLT